MTMTEAEPEDVLAVFEGLTEAQFIALREKILPALRELRREIEQETEKASNGKKRQSTTEEA